MTRGKPNEGRRRKDEGGLGNLSILSAAASGKVTPIRPGDPFEIDPNVHVPRWCLMWEVTQSWFLKSDRLGQG